MTSQPNLNPERKPGRKPSHWVDVTWGLATLSVEAFLDDRQVTALGAFQGQIPWTRPGEPVLEQPARFLADFTSLIRAIDTAHHYLTVPPTPAADASRPCVSLRDLAIILGRGEPSAFLALVRALVALERQADPDFPEQQPGSIATERRSAGQIMEV